MTSTTLKKKEILYNSIPEFVIALENSGTKRLHTFTDTGFLGLGACWAASFISNEGLVHRYDCDINKSFKIIIKPIYDLIEKINVPEVDGIIRVSKRDSSIYQMFQTDAPEEDKNIQASLNAWQNAVLELPVKGTIIQYMKKGSEVVVDAKKGKLHLVTGLDGKENRTLENVLSKVKSYTIQNNTPILNWYLDIKGE